jgi:DNA invertase Pin-like site-specific DNA recombinase
MLLKGSKKMLKGYLVKDSDNDKNALMLSQLRIYGVSEENIFWESYSTYKSSDLILNDLLKGLDENDILVVLDVMDLCKKSKELLKIMMQIAEKIAFLKSLKNEWLDTTTQNPDMMCLNRVIEGLCEVDIAGHSLSTKAGLERTKARGKKGGRPSKREKEKLKIQELHKGGMKMKDIVKLK